MRIFISLFIFEYVLLIFSFVLFEQVLLYNINIEDYYKNTISDMHNEKDYFYHYNDFVHTLDFEILI